MGLKLFPGRKLARMAFMVDFSFTWLSAEPSKCPSNTSENRQAAFLRRRDEVREMLQRYRM